jgi:sporulation protein YlmC with PRC-barrel domain
MYKLSELIGKQAITLLDANVQGTIVNAYFDKTLTKCRYVVLLEEDADNRYYVELKNLSAFSGDAAVVRCIDDIKTQPLGNFVFAPINLPTFNQDGKSLGTVRDVNMEGAKVLSFVTEEGEIPVSTLLSHSEKMLVFNDTGKVIKLKKPLQKSPAPELKTPSNSEGEKQIHYFGENAPSFQSENVPSLPVGIVATAMEEKDVPTVALPPKAASVQRGDNSDAKNQNDMSKYAFLMGKRVQRDIFGTNGGLIARENEMISERTILLAKENGKLVALALHSI